MPRWAASYLPRGLYITRAPEIMGERLTGIAGLGGQVRVRARFGYGESFGPWSAKSDPLKTKPDGSDGGMGLGSGGQMSDVDRQMFEGVSTMSLKARYDCVWKHKVLPHRGDPEGSSKNYSLPVNVAVNERGFHMALQATSTIKATFPMESIKSFRCRGSSMFQLTVGMLNTPNASMQMWAHGMDAHRGEEPYFFVYELETKEGKLLGAAILKAQKEAEQAEVDQMQRLMAASAPTAVSSMGVSSSFNGKTSSS